MKMSGVGDRPEIEEEIEIKKIKDDIPAGTDGRPSATKPGFLKEEEV